MWSSSSLASSGDEAGKKNCSDQEEDSHSKVYCLIRTAYVKLFRLCLTVAIEESRDNVSEDFILHKLHMFIGSINWQMKQFLQCTIRDPLQFVFYSNEHVQYYLLLVYLFHNPSFYQLMRLHQGTISLHCLSLLSLHPRDYDNYHNNSQQFLNNLQQVFESAGLVTREYFSISQFEDKSAKQLAGVTLHLLVRHQDGFASQLTSMLLDCLQEKSKVVCRTTALIGFALISDAISSRMQIVATLLEFIKKAQWAISIPDKHTQQPEQIQFALLLLVSQRYLIHFSQLDSLFRNQFWDLVRQTIQSKTPLTVKLLAIHAISYYSESEYHEDSIQVLTYLNGILSRSEKLIVEVLLCYKHHLEFNHVELLPFHTQILIGVDKLADIMLGLISRFDCNNIVINKCLEIYHVLADKFALEPLKEIQYEDIIEAKLNEVVGALCRAKLSGSDVAFENDLLEILTLLGLKGKRVSETQIEIFRAFVSKLLYEQNRRFSGCLFPYLQMIVHYGQHSFEKDDAEWIFSMCLQNQNVLYRGQEFKESSIIAELDLHHYQSQLLLQTLIASFMDFSPNEWQLIASKLLLQKEIIERRSQCLPITVSTLCLFLACCNHMLAQNEINHIYVCILDHSSALECDAYACRVMVFSLSCLLEARTEIFVKQKKDILKLIISLLRKLTKRSQWQSIEAEQDEDEKEAKLNISKCIARSRNFLTDYDEYSDVRRKILDLKHSDQYLLMELAQQLEEEAKQFLREAFSLERVQNKLRTIYKVKK